MASFARTARLHCCRVFPYNKLHQFIIAIINKLYWMDKRNEEHGPILLFYWVLYRPHIFPPLIFVTKGLPLLNVISLPVLHHPKRAAQIRTRETFCTTLGTISFIIVCKALKWKFLHLAILWWDIYSSFCFKSLEQCENCSMWK